MGKQTALTSFFGRKRAANGEEKVPDGSFRGSQKRGRILDGGDPETLVCWNSNGLGVRLRNERDLKQLSDFVAEHRPDVLCISEARLVAGLEGDEAVQTKIGNPKDRERVREWLSAPPMDEYRCWFSLSSSRYAGTCMLVKEDRVGTPRIKFQLNGESDGQVNSAEPDPTTVHDSDGRIILAEFKSFSLLHTYSPNNGWDEEHFSRRREWDEKIRRFVSMCREKGRPLIWMGDLNVAPEDDDLSHPEWFRSQKSSKHPVPPDPKDRGQPGCTDNERLRLTQVLDCGDLVDVYRVLNPRTEKRPNVEDAVYTWRGTPGVVKNEIGKYYKKGMRIDHALVSRCLLPRAKSVQILGYGADRTNFLGSDHCPILLQLCKEE
mmetsp:Transcript_218/g.538  ORF Transcript_218/g.538 Transcript_218/m.538 type:complete len:377 (-) Transcript_218:1291-2421(-)